VLRWIKGLPTLATIIAGTVGSVLATAAGKIGYGIGYSALSGKSVVIEFSPAPWESFVSVTWK
jgi:hypothetical protein